MSRQQIVVSGVGGQGVLFVTRLLADAAIRRGGSVLTSETHGMAQRGGVVVSHLKAGDFASPLVRTGQADGLFVLKEENLSLHGGFVKSSGWIVLNSARADKTVGGETIHVIDADGLAHGTGNLQAANMILLGFALARLGTADQGGLLFCSPDDIRAVLRQRLGNRERMFSTSVAALDLGIIRGKR